MVGDTPNDAQPDDAQPVVQPVLYEVDLSDHAHHLVTVRMTVPRDVAPGARLVLPTWTPGSYVVRDYVHHVQRIDASRDGEQVTLTPDGRTAWRLPENEEGPVEVELEIYANELTVRTSHVDDHHALLIPPATFPYVEGATDRPHRVTIHAPDGWRVWSLLPEEAGAGVAGDYHHLVDSAFEAGDHEEVAFEVAGVPHRFVWAGHAGRPDLSRIAEDAAAIGEAAVELFGELPVERYTFLCATWNAGRGGLEHRDGAVLMVTPATVTDPDGYQRLQALIAHEYLHLWNVKRLVPAALTDLDYEHPTHTESLWVAEGWTDFYDDLLPLRAGLWDVDRFLKAVGDNVQRVMERPGRQLQSVRRSSHDAWTKLYVHDENSVNAGVSYYGHGAVLAWCLDLLIRRAAPDSDGLDDVVRLLWERFGRGGRPGTSGGSSGYEESDVEALAAEVAGTDLSDFFVDHVSGTAAPPIEELVDTVGLRFTDEDPDDPLPPDLGVQTSEDDQGVVFSSVLRGRPAWRGGLTGGDRLLAIDGLRVERGDLTKVLRGYEAGDTVDVAVFRGPRLVTVPVTLAGPRPDRKLRRVEDPTDEQRAMFRRWTGHDLTEDADDGGGGG